MSKIGLSSWLSLGDRHTQKSISIFMPAHIMSRKLGEPERTIDALKDLDGSLSIREGSTFQPTLEISRFKTNAQILTKCNSRWKDDAYKINPKPWSVCVCVWKLWKSRDKPHPS